MEPHHEGVHDELNRDEITLARQLRIVLGQLFQLDS